MTIRDYLTIVRQRLVVVMLTMLLTTAAALILAIRQAPVYEATSKLQVFVVEKEFDSEYLQKTQIGRNVATEAEVVKSAPVAERVIKRLKLKEPFNEVEELVKNIEITVMPYTEVLEVKVTAPDPRLSSDIANAFPEQYLEMRREDAANEAQRGSEEVAQKMDVLVADLKKIDEEMRATNPDSSRGEFLRRQRELTVSKMSTLNSILQDLMDTSPFKNDSVGKILSYAEPSEGRANGDLARTGVLGLIIGLPLALGVALLLDAMSDTIKGKEEAEKIVGAETLGIIPLTPEWKSSKPYVVTREAPYSAAAEAYRTLRINLDSRRPAGETSKILFTSPGMGEGKSTASANLAVAYSEAGRSVMIVSADLRRPRVHQMFGTPAAPGLAELLRGEREPHEVVQEPSPGLYVLPSGETAERPDQLVTQITRRSLDEMTLIPGSRRRRPRNDENGAGLRNGTGAEQADGETGTAETGRQVVYTQPNVVLLDAPAVLGAAEVSSLAPASDGVVLVLHVGITRRQAAARAAEQIRRAGGNIIGMIMVGVRMDDDYSVYPPADGGSEKSDSTWSKVVAGLRS